MLNVIFAFLGAAASIPWVIPVIVILLLAVIAFCVMKLLWKCFNYVFFPVFKPPCSIEVCHFFSLYSSEISLISAICKSWYTESNTDGLGIFLSFHKFTLRTVINIAWNSKVCFKLPIVLTLGC